MYNNNICIFIIIKPLTTYYICLHIRLYIEAQLRNNPNKISFILRLLALHY